MYRSGGLPVTVASCLVGGDVSLFESSLQSKADRQRFIEFIGCAMTAVFVVSIAVVIGTFTTPENFGDFLKVRDTFTFVLLVSFTLSYCCWYSRHYENCSFRAVPGGIGYDLYALEQSLGLTLAAMRENEQNLDERAEAVLISLARSLIAAEEVERDDDTLENEALTKAAKDRLRETFNLVKRCGLIAKNSTWKPYCNMAKEVPLRHPLAMFS